MVIAWCTDLFFLKKKLKYYIWRKFTFWFLPCLLCLVFFARLHLVLYNARWWTWLIQGLFQCTRWWHGFAFAFFSVLLIFTSMKSNFWSMGFILGEFWCKDGVWYDPELQSATGSLQQAENWEGICFFSPNVEQNTWKRALL